MTLTPVAPTWRFMDSYKLGYKSPNMGYRYSYPTYNLTYSYPMNLQVSKNPKASEAPKA